MKLLELAVISLLYAPTLAQSGSTIHRFTGDAQFDGYGRSAAMADDVNGDGYCDVIAGVQDDDDNGTDSGAAFVYSGLDGTILHRFDGDLAGDRLGFAVDGAGDVDADGYADLIVGAAFANGQAGYARIYSGQTGAVIHTFLGTGAARLGAHTRGAGDLNADGHADVLVGSGSHQYTNIYSGLDGALLYQVFGDSHKSVDGVGDVDGDGFDDFATGHSTATGPAGTSAGVVHVYSGRTGASIYTWDGAVQGARLGTIVAAAGDVNADGFADVLFSRGFPQSTVFVHSGRDGSVLHAIDGPSGTSFGTAAHGVGDIDADGYDDFAVGAHLEDGHLLQVGSVRLYSGQTGAMLHRYDGLGQTEKFGWLVDGNGDDVDGDGISDFLVATPFASPGSRTTGLVQIVTYRVLFPSIERVHGAGCPGGNGWVPRIGYGGFAHTGRLFEVTLRGAVPNSAHVALSIGNSTTVPLDSIGLAGCTIYVDPFVSVATTSDAFGMSSMTLGISGDAGLVGFPFEMQWSIADASAPYALPLTFSDALSIVIGG